MLYYILMFFVCLLSVYGAYSLVSAFVGTINPGYKAGSAKARVIIAVRDAEEQIEFIVRNAANADLASRLMSGGGVTFVDMGSRDGTVYMLQKLKQDYENIEVLGADERDNAFSPLRF